VINWIYAIIYRCPLHIHSIDHSVIIYELCQNNKVLSIFFRRCTVNSRTVITIIIITTIAAVHHLILFRYLFSFYHTSHDSVSVVRTTFNVHGKMQNLILSQPKTPEPIVTKFEWRDYVVDAYYQKTSGSIRPEIFAPHIGEIYTPPVRNLLHFLVLQLVYRRVR